MSSLKCGGGGGWGGAGRGGGGDSGRKEGDGRGKGEGRGMEELGREEGDRGAGKERKGRGKLGWRYDGGHGWRRRMVTKNKQTKTVSSLEYLFQLPYHMYVLFHFHIYVCIYKCFVYVYLRFLVC